MRHLSGKSEKGPDWNTMFSHLCCDGCADVLWLSLLHLALFWNPANNFCHVLFFFHLSSLKTGCSPYKSVLSLSSLPLLAIFLFSAAPFPSPGPAASLQNTERSITSTLALETGTAPASKFCWLLLYCTVCVCDIFLLSFVCLDDGRLYKPQWQKHPLNLFLQCCVQPEHQFGWSWAIALVQRRMQHSSVVQIFIFILLTEANVIWLQAGRNLC